MPGRIHVINPAGKRGTVPEERLSAVLAKGYRLPTPEEEAAGKREKELQEPINIARTAGEGLLRSATFGLSDPFMVGAGVPAEDIKARQELSPVASTVGEIGGYLTPGPGLVGKAAGAIGKAAAPTIGKVAGRAVGAGIEGGIYGLGTAISEESLGDPGVVGEKAFAMGGVGALTGGAMSLGGTGIAAGGSKLLSALGGSGLRETLKNFSSRVTVRQMAQKSDYNKMNLLGRATDIGDYAWRKGIVTAGSTAETVYEKAVEASVKEGQVINRMLVILDDRAPAGFDMAKFTAQAQQKILDPLSRDPALRGEASALKSLIEGYQDFGPGGKIGKISWREAFDKQSSLRRSFNPKTDTPYKEQKLHELQSLFMDEISRQSKDVSPHFPKLFSTFRKNYGAAQQLENLAAKTLERQEGNRYFGMSDTQVGQAVGIAGAVLTGSPVGLVAGVGGAVANKLARERGGFMVGAAARKLSESIEPMAKVFHKNVQATLEASPQAFGAFRAVMATAAARGAMETLATHVQLANSDPNYLLEAGMQDETPDAANQYAVKADQLGALSGVIQDHDAKLDAAIGRFLGKQTGAAPKFDAQEMDTTDYRERYEALTRLVADPAALAEAIKPPQALTENAPEAAMAMSQTALRAAQFLYSRAPKNPRIDPIAALADGWEPNAVDLDRWRRYVDAIERPGKILDDLRYGSISQEAVEALREVYPNMLEELQERMLSRLSGYDAQLTYSQKSALSVLFENPIGNVMEPARMALIQEAYKGVMESGMVSSKPVKGSSAANMATQSQRIEGR